MPRDFIQGEQVLTFAHVFQISVEINRRVLRARGNWFSAKTRDPLIRVAPRRSILAARESFLFSTAFMEYREAFREW